MEKFISIVERKINPIRIMKELTDFDLSIIMTFQKSSQEFKHVFSSKINYYERNGIEIIIIIDASVDQKEILNYICDYPFIQWKLIIFNQKVENYWSVEKALNIGIRNATKQYILIVDSNLEFCTDVIYELRENLDFYPEHYAISSFLLWDNNLKINEYTMKKYSSEQICYSCIMGKKEYFERIGGYNENYTYENVEYNYIQKRFELIGIKKLFFPDSVVISHAPIMAGTPPSKTKRTHIPLEILSKILLPTTANVNGDKWGHSLNRIIYDWKKHPYAKEQCRKYLSTFEASEISSENIFQKSYPLIALIPAYNESERIMDCLHSMEKYCDGIILLDDGSIDDTYRIAQSKKLLLKVKKVRVEFNDKQNRNILLDLASFFKAEWFIFIDADERFDDRFVDLKEVMKNPDIDTVGVWIVNVWNSMETYRIDMKDVHPFSQNGLWFRWRMFRNKGRMQLNINRKLHFSTIPYKKEGRNFISKSLLIHIGYIDKIKRLNKYDFYQQEDKDQILYYNNILCENCQLGYLKDISLPTYI